MLSDGPLSHGTLRDGTLCDGTLYTTGRYGTGRNVRDVLYSRRFVQEVDEERSEEVLAGSSLDFSDGERSR
jgi:hypothetical protein